MNRVMLIGRLVREPEIRYGGNETSFCIARYTLAVSRRGSGEGADFIRCVTFGKHAEFAEKYLEKGTKLAVWGRIQTGSFVTQDGRRVYTTDVIVEEQEFAESKKKTEVTAGAFPQDGFVQMSDEMDEGGLPFV